jgi:hypothetical protein
LAEDQKDFLPSTLSDARICLLRNGLYRNTGAFTGSFRRSIARFTLSRSEIRSDRICFVGV